MPYRRTSHRALSGPWAALIGKRVTWESNLAPADPTALWTRHEGRIAVVGCGEVGQQSYCVQETSPGRLYGWIDESGEMPWQRNIKVVE